MPGIHCISVWYPLYIHNIPVPGISAWYAPYQLHKKNYLWLTSLFVHVFFGFTSYSIFHARQFICDLTHGHLLGGVAAKDLGSILCQGLVFQQTLNSCRCARAQINCLAWKILHNKVCIKVQTKSAYNNSGGPVYCTSSQTY